MRKRVIVTGASGFGQNLSLLRKDDSSYISGENSLLKESTGWTVDYNIYDTVD